MQNEKIGILTLSSAENYGAVLQSHSLCKFLNDYYGYTEIIDFVPDFMVGRYPIFWLNKENPYKFLKSLIIALLYLPILLKKRKRFNDFRYKESVYSQKKYYRVFDEDIYDKYIVGSDQVFNLELTRYDEEFFLPHVKDNSKKNTYAASLGVTQLDNKSRILLEKYLKNFNSISIREKTGCEMINSLLNNHVAQQMCDPIFLNGKKYWESKCGRKLHNKKYVLIYTFKNLGTCIDICNTLNQNLDVLYINNDFRKCNPRVKNIRGVGPREFLSLIKNAECVITDSFHGMAFSIVFNIDFYAILYPGTESRFKDLLNALELDSRIVCGPIDMNRIDYSRVNKHLETMRYKSKKYFDSIFM